METNKKRLVIQVIGTDYLFQLTEDFERKVMFEGKEYTVKVPNGFCTDIVSIPKPFWSWISPFGKYQEAAVLHDFLYSFEGQLDGLDRTLTRKESDEFFYEVMVQDGVKKSKAKLMKKAVRTFGWKYWKKNLTKKS